MTTKVQSPSLLAASVALQVTSVAPLLKVEPDTGLHVTKGVVPELSVADSPLNVTLAVVPPLSYSTAMSAGQVTTGAVVSAFHTEIKIKSQAQSETFVLIYLTF